MFANKKLFFRILVFSLTIVPYHLDANIDIDMGDYILANKLAFTVGVTSLGFLSRLSKDSLDHLIESRHDFLSHTVGIGLVTIPYIVTALVTHQSRSAAERRLAELNHQNQTSSEQQEIACLNAQLNATKTQRFLHYFDRCFFYSLPTLTAYGASWYLLGTAPLFLSTMSLMLMPPPLIFAHAFGFIK